MPAAQPTLEDRVLLLLAVKAEGKRVGLAHVAEKVLRDHGRGSEADVRAALDGLVAKGLAVEERGGFAATPEGLRALEERLPSVADALNLSYRLVHAARTYYPRVAEQILPFLEGRPVSVVKVFSDEADPARSLKPLFVRYARAKPKPIHNRIASPRDLQRFVDEHAVDFIPYVHREGAREPDWLVLDLDLGEAIKNKPEGFALLRLVATTLVEALEGFDLVPAAKFSGSRGIQVWAALDNGRIPKAAKGSDAFALYRRLAVFLQGEAERRLQELPEAEQRALRKVAGEGGAFTTSTVAKKEERERQVLVDWSSLKPQGDVRAPFSLHYKTGKASVPIAAKRLPSFQPEEAEPARVAAQAASLARHFVLEPRDPRRLLEAAKGAAVGG